MKHMHFASIWFAMSILSENHGHKKKKKIYRRRDARIREISQLERKCHSLDYFQQTLLWLIWILPSCSKAIAWRNAVSHISRICCAIRPVIPGSFILGTELEDKIQEQNQTHKKAIVNRRRREGPDSGTERWLRGRDELPSGGRA